MQKRNLQVEGRILNVFVPSKRTSLRVVKNVTRHLDALAGALEYGFAQIKASAQPEYEACQLV